MPQLEKKQELVIISFNAFGSPFYAYKVLKTLFMTHVYKRLLYLSDQLNKSDADIIALQEVNTYPQYFYLKARLVDFPYVYYRKYFQGPKGGLVFFSKIPFESISYVTFDKMGSLHGKSIIAQILKRGLLIGKVKGMALTVINTHLTHNLSHDWSENSAIRPIHTSQLAQIVKFLLKNKDNSESVILTGDFNIPKESDLFRDFLDQATVNDVFYEYTKSTYHEEFTFKDSPLGRVDHMFLFKNGSDVTIQQKKHLFEQKVTLRNGKQYYLSDHIGLYARFKFGE